MKVHDMRETDYKDYKHCPRCGSEELSIFHLVSGDGISEEQTEELREHVDNALHNPGYAIVTNFYIDWHTQIVCNECSTVKVVSSEHEPQGENDG